MENPPAHEMTTPNFFSRRFRELRDSVLNALMGPADSTNYSHSIVDGGFDEIS
jgi:hypothetical protein